VAFALAGTSPPITSFPLSMQTHGGSGTVGLTNTILEVKGILEEEATYPSPILSVGLFKIDSIWVSFSSLTSLTCCYLLTCEMHHVTMAKPTRQ
jgi:hypothetical protein